MGIFLWAVLCATPSLPLSVIAHADSEASATDVAYSLAGTSAPPKTGPKANLSGFRVRSTIATDVQTLFALFMNTGGIETWAYGVSEAQVLKQLTEDADLLYLYSDTPWPVRDRDMVVVRVSEASPDGQTFRILWHCIPDSSVHSRKNIVRVRSCESEFLLRRINADSTELDYRVNIDPAGALPAWARRWFARKAPGETLARIVERVEEMEKERAR